MTFDTLQARNTLQTRRRFFQRSAGALGMAALAQFRRCGNP